VHGARSHSTQRPWTRWAPTARPSCSSATAGDYEDHDLVFANELGGLIRPDALTERFRSHRRAAGIPTGTLHTLRHTAATLMLTSGVPVHIVAARLGDDPETVLSTYARLLPQSDEIAAERVAAALGAGQQ
jgi:integrase